MSNVTFITAQARSERKTIRVSAPTAHAGIGNALREAFAAPALSQSDRDFLRKLDQV